MRNSLYDASKHSFTHVWGYILDPICSGDCSFAREKDLPAAEISISTSQAAHCNLDTMACGKLQGVLK